MAQMWKSQNGYIKLRDMEIEHLANAWATILRKIHDNSMLPESLVKATERDYYDGERLQDLSNNFRDEWGYRFESGILSPAPKPAPIKPKYNQGVGMYSGCQSFDWE
jgi:hypothetical protein